MTRRLPGADVDLSGSWLGLYSYPSGRPPVSFTAELTEIRFMAYRDDCRSRDPARGERTHADGNSAGRRGTATRSNS